MWHVGNATQEVIEIRLNPLQLLLQRLPAVRLCVDLRNKLGSVLPLGFKLGNLCGNLIAFCLQLLRLGLHGLASRFQLREFVNGENITAVSEPSRDRLQVTAQQLNVKHPVSDPSNHAEAPTAYYRRMCNANDALTC